jgi:hypothetical protein
MSLIVLLCYHNSGVISMDEVEAYYVNRLHDNKESLRAKHSDATQLETKLLHAEVDTNAAKRMLKKQDLDHDSTITWDDYLNYRAWDMRLQGRLTTRLPERKRLHDNGNHNTSLVVPHHARKRSHGDGTNSGINSIKAASYAVAPPSIPLISPLGFATPPDTERRHRKHRHRHHHHAADHAVDADPTPRLHHHPSSHSQPQAPPSGGMIPSLSVTTSNASGNGPQPPSPDKEKRKSAHRSRRHHSSKKDREDTSSVISTLPNGTSVASSVDGEHKEKDKHRRKSKSKERRHRSKERRHRSKERGSERDSKQQSTTPSLPAL